MTSDSANHFVTAAATGGALLFAGIVALVTGCQRPVSRLFLAATTGGLAAVGAFALTGDPLEAARTAAVLAAVYAVTAVAGSPYVADALGRARRAFARPVVRSGAVAAAGFLTVFGTAVAYDRSDADQDYLTDLDVYVQACALPDRRPASQAAVTDRGGRIELFDPVAPRTRAVLTPIEDQILKVAPPPSGVIRRAAAADTANCFGWVFADGRHWVTDQAVSVILDDNGYRPVADPRPGDLVVYRSPADNRVTHAAVVRYVTEGMPVLVEGKWGWMGVFIHVVDQSAYGANYAYYRSPRPSHAVHLPHDSDPHHLTGAE